MPQEQNQIFVSLQLQTDNVGYLNSVKFATLETQLQSKKKRRRKIENIILNLYWSTKLNKAKQEPMTSHRLSPEQSLVILTQFALLFRR